MKEPGQKIYTAYSFHMVSGENSESCSDEDLLKYCLISAKKQNMDVFNALNIAQKGGKLLESGNGNGNGNLRFLKGNGKLFYFFYNLFDKIEPEKIGIYSI